MKSPILHLVLIPTLFFVPHSLYAMTAAGGAGTDSCGAWTEDRKTENSWRRAEQWVKGYLAGTTDNLSTNLKSTDADYVLEWLDGYCQTNPMSRILDAVRSMSSSVGIVVIGPGNTEGQLASQSEMNQICRDSYPGFTDGAFPVRWATTTDFREYSTQKGWDYLMPTTEDRVALRAEETTFTPDGRSYDQATGAFTPAQKIHYPGAVIISLDNAFFGGKRTLVKPVCVYGAPNPELR